MAKIHILDKRVAELIAAGEVVERPASIVKELVENSVDAGASKITIEIQNGGVKYIRITDDGCGIERSDVENAFIRHATSKVLTAQDLESIYTFAFRGEALASISAMCKVELLTRTQDEITGTRYMINDSDKGEISDAGCPVGTTIIVRDIFYNTPARMKFLKKDVSEGNSVSSIIDRIALSNPSVSIKYIRDGVIKLNTPGNGDMLSAIHSVFGKELTDGLIKTDTSVGNVRVSGFVSKPTASKATRTMQIFFVNSRYVRSRTCTAAVEEAFKSSIMTGKFPACVLNVEIPPQTVDVNIHPAKTEVRFSDEKAIFDAVYSACKNAINEHNKAQFITEDTEPQKKLEINQFTLNAFDYTSSQEKLNLSQRTAPSQPLPQALQKPAIATQEHISYTKYREIYTPQSTQKTGSTASLRSPVPAGFSGEPQKTAFSVKTYESPQINTDLDMPAQHQEQRENTYPIEQEQATYTIEHDTLPQAPDINAVGDLKLVGELFSTYIVLEGQDMMLLVDKHAAHERYLYNKLKANIKEMDRQVLLSPITISLPREEYSAVVLNTEDFLRLGFVVEDFGEGAVIVREMPLLLGNGDISQLISEIAGKLIKGNNDLTPNILEELYHSIACRSAVKANDKSASLELIELVSLIAEDFDIRYCPHGRPISIKMTKREIEKMFGRLG